MEAKLVSFENKEVGVVPLTDYIFGLESREDIVKRVIDWQLAKRRSGTHSVKNVGEVSGSTKKPFKQKGTGNARQGNARGVQRRGGGIAHGPQIRSHAIKLQKKVRVLGMRHALSSKLASGELHVIESLSMDKPKTKDFISKLSKFGAGKFFIVDGSEVNENIKRSSSAVENVNVVPAIGANVYDIIKSDRVIITKNGLAMLEERLK
ncbi:MAG: hypothetical protein DGJ47_000530 [Rickettsiaceae bacterium]